MSYKKAKEKLSKAFDRNYLHVAIGNQERENMLIKLLSKSSADTITGSIFEAIRFYLNHASKPDVDRAKEKLKNQGYLTEKGIEKLDDDKVMELYSGYFSTPVTGETDEIVTEIDLSNETNSE